MKNRADERYTVTVMAENVRTGDAATTRYYFEPGGEIVVTAARTGEGCAGELRGEWLGLPASEAERKAAWERIGAPEEVFFTDYEAEDVPGIAQNLGEYEGLEQLNELAKGLEDMNEAERLTLAAVLEAGIAGAHGAAELLELCEEVRDGVYMLIEGISNEEDLGYCYMESTGAIDELPEWARGYFDYEAYGRDVSIEACGAFCGAGWIEKTT